VRHYGLSARAVFLLLPALVLLGQNPPPTNDPAAPAAPASESGEHARIFGVLPDFLTVQTPDEKVQPLTVKQKFALVARQTYDPVTILSAAGGALLSQARDEDPKYGEGRVAYAKRFGAAIADLSSQNFFGGAVFASLLHEDPRYFRRGPRYGFWNRLGYSISKVVVTRTDAGRQSFNYAGILGMSLGIGLSNAYYPAASVNGREVAQRFGTSLLSASLGNILPEFWPDIHGKLFHHKASGSAPAPASKP